MKETITKTIVFRFTNKLTKELEVSLRVPYLPYLATTGYYSSLYKRIKYAAAFDCEPGLIDGRKYFETGKSDRALMVFGNGVKFDFPYNVTPKEVKIIKHHLEGIKMSLKD